MDLFEFLDKTEGGKEHIEYARTLVKERNAAEKNAREASEKLKLLGGKDIADVIAVSEWVAKEFPKGVDDIVELRSKAAGATADIEKIKAEKQQFANQLDEWKAKTETVQKELVNANIRSEVMPVLTKEFGSETTARLIMNDIFNGLSIGEDRKIYRKNGEKIELFADSVAKIKEEYVDQLPKAAGSGLPKVDPAGRDASTHDAIRFV